jgi:predicted RecB family nuclease
LTDRRTRERLERDELTMLWNLGKGKVRKLAANGVKSPGDLEHRCPAGVRPEEIAGWRAHIAAYRTGTPQVFGPLSIPDAPYFVLDTEYDTLDPSHRVFLIALWPISKDEQSDIRVWWAPTEDGEKTALLGLREALEAHPDWPIMTWNGVNADRSFISKAEARLGMEGLTERLDRSLFDAFLEVKGSVRFPVPGLSLKAVAVFAGVSRKSGVDGARRALSFYRSYRRSPLKTDSKPVVASLKKYVEDDVVSLAEVLNYLRQLSR